MAKSSNEIDKEKSVKTRPDLVPSEGQLMAGHAMAYGAKKHGLANNGVGTYREPYIEQARVATHIASMERHLAAVKSGEYFDPESDLPHWCHFMAQANIVMNLIVNPPGKVHEHDLRWMNPEIAWDVLGDEEWNTYADLSDTKKEELWEVIERQIDAEKAKLTEDVPISHDGANPDSWIDPNAPEPETDCPMCCPKFSECEHNPANKKPKRKASLDV